MHLLDAARMRLLADEPIKALRLWAAAERKQVPGAAPVRAGYTWLLRQGRETARTQTRGVDPSRTVDPAHGSSAPAPSPWLRPAREGSPPPAPTTTQKS